MTRPRIRCTIVPWSALAVALVGCHRVPAGIRPSLDRHRSQIEALALSAGARCAEIRTGGLAALVNGTVPMSPAAGTALDADPEVLQVSIDCEWPVPGSATGGMGNLFLPLRAPSERRNGAYEAYGLSGAEARHDVEEVWTPAIQIADPAAFDVHIQRATPSGGWVDIVVTLKPGNRTLPPPPPRQLPLRRE